MDYKGYTIIYDPHTSPYQALMMDKVIIIHPKTDINSVKKMIDRMEHPKEFKKRLLDIINE